MPNGTEKSKAKIFLVDDHPMVREHLTALIQSEPDLEVCGEAADAPTALAMVTSIRPDLVILDISLKRSHGLELLKDLRAVWPDLPVLILSMHDETLYAERALAAGAMGYITKQEATLNVLSAIRKVVGGEVYLSEHMSARMMKKMIGSGSPEPATPMEALTDREFEVYQMIGRGLGTRQIADELRLGIKSVESYRARIREKLRLADGNQLLQHAIHWTQGNK